MRHLKSSDHDPDHRSQAPANPANPAPPPYNDDIPVLETPFPERPDESRVKEDPRWQQSPEVPPPLQHHILNSRLSTVSQNPLRWPLLIAAALLVLDLGSYTYVRYAKVDSGFTGATPYTTFHYDTVFGENGTPSLVLFAHWPLMKIEGIVRGRKMMMFANEDFITVHDPR